MVVICSDTEYNGPELAEFGLFGFPLSVFQKYSISALINGHHSLITAHTGSGKTLPAEFAIQYFCGNRASAENYDGEINGCVDCGERRPYRVIYCSPIKSLSNQKYYEFTRKYGDKISFGILTGDIKSNPDADVLIMTTEILLNTLYRKMRGDGESSKNTGFSFDIDLEKELACVVFDEVHYINDKDRGHVWEQCMMLLPPHVQLLMLSATIDRPEKFAEWIEERYPDSAAEVWLSSTNFRVVPLTHYCYLTAPENFFKRMDKETAAATRKFIGKPLVIQDSGGKFVESTYHQIRLLKDSMYKEHIQVNRKFALNNVVSYLKENEMLPAICFVLSRKQVQEFANDIHVNLLEDDSKIPYTIARECEQIVRRLPNFQEYLNLPEYIHLVSLLEKGIAYHHSGVLPVLREIVELFICRGMVKLLFATETFAIGLDCPIKTTIFTGFKKFDGDSSRILHSHEYTQMAGRAGRRGLDKVGHVIHCMNMIQTPTLAEYQKMLKGKPQRLVSKYRIGYSMLLNVDGDEQNALSKKSMAQRDLDKDRAAILSQIDELKKSVDFDYVDNYETLAEYIKLVDLVSICSIKQKKKYESQIEAIERANPSIREFAKKKKESDAVCDEINKLERELDSIDHYFEDVVEQTKKVLYPEFINRETGELTPRGKVAAGFRECHPLIIADLYVDGYLKPLSTAELCGVFSCFANINCDDDAVLYTNADSKPLKKCVDALRDRHEYYAKLESAGLEVDEAVVQYNIIDYVVEWFECGDEVECKSIIQRLNSEKGIFLGEFVKAILKICCLSAEMELVADCDVEMLIKLRDVKDGLLKFVATNQSLYV